MIVFQCILLNVLQMYFISCYLYVSRIFRQRRIRIFVDVLWIIISRNLLLSCCVTGTIYNLGLHSQLRAVQRARCLWAGSTRMRICVTQLISPHPQMWGWGRWGDDVIFIASFCFAIGGGIYRGIVSRAYRAHSVNVARMLALPIRLLIMHLTPYALHRNGNLQSGYSCLLSFLLRDTFLFVLALQNTQPNGYNCHIASIEYVKG